MSTCQSMFVVPRKQASNLSGRKRTPTAPAAVLESRYKTWMNDIRLHMFDPQAQDQAGQSVE